MSVWYGDPREFVVTAMCTCHVRPLCGCNAHPTGFTAGGATVKLGRVEFAPAADSDIERIARRVAELLKASP